MSLTSNVQNLSIFIFNLFLDRYALAPVKYINSDDVPFGDTDDLMFSVNMWKQDTLRELFQTKNEPKRSVPVLSTVGAQALYWEKQVIETVPSGAHAESKHLTYCQVHNINQNRESQRYKRRLERNKKH